MSPDHISQLFIGIEEAKRGNTLLGMQLLNGLQEDSPHHLFYEAKAWFSYCLAKKKRDFNQAISACQDAREKKLDSSEICLALGRIYLLAGHRSAAIRVLQHGFDIDNNRGYIGFCTVSGFVSHRCSVFSTENTGSILSPVVCSEE